MDFGRPGVIWRRQRRDAPLPCVQSPRTSKPCVRAKGMRMTEQRRVIARVLAAADDHPDVEELLPALRRDRRAHLDLDRLPHRQAVRGCRHHRAPRFPRRPRPLRADARHPSRPPDQPAHRRGDRVPVRGDRAAAGRDRAPSSATGWSTTGSSSTRCRSTTRPPPLIVRSGLPAAAGVTYTSAPKAAATEHATEQKIGRMPDEAPSRGSDRLGRIGAMRVRFSARSRKLPLPDPSLTPAQLAGRNLFAQHCVVCHVRTLVTVRPQLRARHCPKVSLGGQDDVLRELISNGTPNMPGFKYSSSPPRSTPSSPT